MKVNLSIFLLVVGVLLVLLHDEMTNGMTILSDIPNDPTVSDGWPWFVGATGVILSALGAVFSFVGWIQRRESAEEPASTKKGDGRLARVAAQKRRNDAVRQLENRES